MRIIYKITYPNGKIYIGKHTNDNINYFGSADPELIEKDFTKEQKRDFTVRKQILWASETVTDDELHKKEIEYIISNRSNDPVIGYNRSPKYNLLDIKPGDRDGNQTCQEVRKGGRFQLWKTDNGGWGVVEIVNNKYKIHMRISGNESSARDLLEIFAPIADEPDTEV